jgi:exonuclease III
VRLTRIFNACSPRETRALCCGHAQGRDLEREWDSQARFASILEAGALTDLSRKFSPDDDRLFSWWAPWRNLREKNVGWRIDYILASEPLDSAAVSCQVQREFGKSDHGPLIAEFALPATQSTYAALSCGRCVWDRAPRDL